MQGAFNFMIIFDIFIGVYLLYYAIKGSGKAYENDYPEEMQTEHRRLLRLFCWITGAPLLVLSILEYMSPDKAMSIWSIISIIYILGCVVTYFIIFRIKFKEYLKDPRKRLPKK